MKSSVSKKSSPKAKKEKKVEGFICSFCPKVYKRESAFLSHICRGKKRFFEKDTKAARLAFAAYTRFYEVHMPTHKAPTHEGFMTNSLYDAFLAFGKYILDIDAISPKDYIDYMVRSKVKIDYWCRDSEYEKYVSNLAMRETPERALERTCLLMREWAIKESADSADFFRLISTNRATMWIRNGRISPWVLLNCRSGSELLGRLSDEQMSILSPTLNIKLWKGKFARHTGEVEELRTALEMTGL